VRFYQVREFAPLQVIQLDARVAVHVAAHHRLARRGVGVDVALAPVEVVRDAHGVIGDEGLQNGRVVVKCDDCVAVQMVVEIEGRFTAVGLKPRRGDTHAVQLTPHEPTGTGVGDAHALWAS